MTLFRVIAGLVIAGLITAILRDLRRGRRSWGEVWGFIREQTGTAFGFWRGRQRFTAGSKRGNLRRLTYILSSGFLLVLALTGFLPVLFLGERLSGPLLIIHVTAAPLFALCLSALALLWAHRFRFDEDDWHIVLDPSRRRSSTRQGLMRLALKVGFWAALLFSLPLMGSIIMGLFPIFGTEGQEALVRIHGYSAVCLLLVSIVVIHLTVAYNQDSPERTSKENAS